MTTTRLARTPKATGTPGLGEHLNGNCGCSIARNPRNCPYQPFLDGWDFTPDVGHGATRGEIFTPRYIVDQMIVQARIMPAKAILHGDYSGSETTLRKYIGGRVFEPAVGTGNYTATILWHKLNMADVLTGKATRQRGGNRKTATQLRRYQAYTLVALGSVYFNDIDPGNLQTTKWRILRDNEIGADENVTYWVNHVYDALADPPDRAALQPAIRASVKAASHAWGVGDRDRGVLDVLYEKHTGQTAPAWLRNAWKTVLDENAKLFNGLEDADTVVNGLPTPGRNSAVWTFWHFHNHINSITADRIHIPLARQLAIGKAEGLRNQISAVPLVEKAEAEPDLFGTAPALLPRREDAPRLSALTAKLKETEKLLTKLPPFHRGVSVDFPRASSPLTDIF